MQVQPSQQAGGSRHRIEAVQTPDQLQDGPESKFIQNLKQRIRELKVSGDFMDLFADPLPEALSGHYPVKNVDARLSRQIQRKYKRRPTNLLRCWNRVQLFLPELMHHYGPRRRVLEMSTAHGGMLEVLRYFGHDVLGNDYLNLTANRENNRAFFREVNDANFKRSFDDYGLPVPENGDAVVDWPYRAIIESIGIPMKLFDGGLVPYPFEDKEFDVLICMQAIDHYCHPKDWLSIIDEFCRVTRKSIVLVLNPLIRQFNGMPDDYPDAYNEARLALRSYRRNGFACSSCHMMWGEPVGFKLTAE